MHLYNLFCGIAIPLSNSEHQVMQKVNKTISLPSYELSDHENYIANELCIKGILKSSIKDNIMNYYIDRIHLDREPLI